MCLKSHVILYWVRLCSIRTFTQCVTMHFERCARTYERLLLDSIQKSLSGARSVFHFRFLSCFLFVQSDWGCCFISTHQATDAFGRRYFHIFFVRHENQFHFYFRWPTKSNMNRSVNWNDFSFVRILEVILWATKLSISILPSPWNSGHVNSDDDGLQTKYTQSTQTVDVSLKIWPWPW